MQFYVESIMKIEFFDDNFFVYLFGEKLNKEVCTENTLSI